MVLAAILLSVPGRSIGDEAPIKKEREVKKSEGLLQGIAGQFQVVFSQKPVSDKPKDWKVPYDVHSVFQGEYRQQVNVYYQPKEMTDEEVKSQLNAKGAPGFVKGSIKEMQIGDEQAIRYEFKAPVRLPDGFKLIPAYGLLMVVDKKIVIAVSASGKDAKKFVDSFTVEEKKDK
jgi:hypothetical protein